MRKKSYEFQRELHGSSKAFLVNRPSNAMQSIFLLIFDQLLDQQQFNRMMFVWCILFILLISKFAFF